MLTTKTWKLPKPDKKAEVKYHQVVRVGRHIPFGYKQNEEDPDLLDPIPKELDLLEQAKKHVKKYSYRNVADWLTHESGRKITHEGLRKRINLESRRKRDVANARLYAKRAEEAAKKADEIERRLGGKACSASDSSDRGTGQLRGDA